MNILRRSNEILPGLIVSLAVTALATGLERLEVMLTGYPWIDALVFAIILGALFHTFFGLRAEWQAGISFCTKTLLEIAIVLIGATIGAGTLLAGGPWLIMLVAATVFMSLGVSYLIGRSLGLPQKLAILVACGNSICGNSAIVAAAPVVRACPDDVASSIAFTAALGIVVVLLLPVAGIWMSLDQVQYGVVAGMTVYAVPQVLAATVPYGALSTQTGAVVKLMRVLMLGPVILLLGMSAGRRDGIGKLSFLKLVPWFITGFLVMIGIRSAGLVPEWLASIFSETSSVLTLVSMAALGLSVNIRSVMTSGGRVLAAGVLSLVALASMSLVMLSVLPG